MRAVSIALPGPALKPRESIPLQRAKTADKAAAGAVDTAAHRRPSWAYAA